MFDVAPTELLLVGLVALVVIGPKDLPKVMRVVGQWVGRAKGMMRQFRSGFDAMVREAELEDMEKQWASENERIMREHADDAGAVTPEAISPTVIAESPAAASPAAVDDQPALPLPDPEPRA